MFIYIYKCKACIYFLQLQNYQYIPNKCRNKTINTNIKRLILNTVHFIKFSEQ